MLRLYGRQFNTDDELQIIQDDLEHQRIKTEKFRNNNKNNSSINNNNNNNKNKNNNINTNNKNNNKISKVAERLRDGLMTKFRQLKVPEVYKPILIVMLMSVIQQFSGMTILRAYVVKIFHNIFAEEEDSTTKSKVRLCLNRLGYVRLVNVMLCYVRLGKDRIGEESEVRLGKVR